jgi:hypothetical protein
MLLTKKANKIAFCIKHSLKIILKKVSFYLSKLLNLKKKDMF